MSGTQTATIFRILCDLEAGARAHAAGLPQQEQHKTQWNGIGFRIGKMEFVAPLDHVREILVSPPVSRVPGAKEWVRGIANVRGTLLPILDLQGFLSGEPADRGRRTRVLVVEHQGVYAGLMVDEIAGLRHFFVEDSTTQLPAVPEPVREYLSGAFRHDDKHIALFDMHRLIADPAFMQVAA